jgi:hypothetical protein
MFEFFVGVTVTFCVLFVARMIGAIRNENALAREFGITDARSDDHGKNQERVEIRLSYLARNARAAFVEEERARQAFTNAVERESATQYADLQKEYFWSIAGLARRNKFWVPKTIQAAAEGSKV